MTSRMVEVFTAGCPVCEEAVTLIRGLLCESCNLEVLDLKTAAALAKAREYGITGVPTVVVNGTIADCCCRGGVDAGVLRSLGVGSRVYRNDQP